MIFNAYHKIVPLSDEFDYRNLQRPAGSVLSVSSRNFNFASNWFRVFIIDGGIVFYSFLLNKKFIWKFKNIVGFIF